MALLDSNENLPAQVVDVLRRLGQDVPTSFEAGNANRAIPDSELLAYAASNRRILLTHNRLHFIRLHGRNTGHAGIVVCTYDPDFRRQAQSIHDVIEREADTAGKLIRVNRPR